jgi:hypothetical protein
MSSESMVWAAVIIAVVSSALVFGYIGRPADGSAVDCAIDAECSAAIFHKIAKEQYRETAFIGPVAAAQRR